MSNKDLLKSFARKHNSDELICLTSNTQKLFTMLNEARLFDEMTQEQHEERWGQLVGAIEYNRSMFRQVAPGSIRAQVVHDKIDAFIEHDKSMMPEEAKELTCKKGCSACCYQFVGITEDEADLLKSHLTPERIEYLKVQSQFTQTPDGWAEQFPKSKCVFLDNNTCSVYDKRPTACRNYMVASPPSECSVMTNNKVKLFVSVNAEALATAALTESKVGSMATMLLETLNK